MQSAIDTIVPACARLRGSAPSEVASRRALSRTFFRRSGALCIAGVCLPSTASTIIPPNDNCGAAIIIASYGGTPFTNAGATNDGPAGCDNLGADVWFRYTACVSGAHTVDTCAGGAFDSVLGVYSGACGSLALIGCNDDTCGSSSSVTWAAVAGNTYIIRVGGFAGAMGSGTLTLSGPACGPSCCCPDGVATSAQSYVFHITGNVGAGDHPWRISFPGGAGCLQLNGTVPSPVGSHPNSFARFLAAGINEVAESMAASGIVKAGWSPECVGCPGAYVYVNVYGCAAGTPCPMTLCIDAGLGSECCIPPGPSCGSGPAVASVSLAGADCDGNGIDDLVDRLSGRFTDENMNMTPDQCEGVCIPAPLGAPFTVFGSATVTCGPDGGITLGDGSSGVNGGIQVDTRGFDSLAIAFGISTTDAPPLTSTVTLQSRGDIAGNPNEVRGTVRLELSQAMPAEYRAFADYAPIGATHTLVRLVDSGGQTLRTALFPDNPGTPLVRMSVPPNEIEVDARVTYNTQTARRAGILRFTAPIAVTILGADPVTIAQVAEVQLIAHGTVFPELGVLDSVWMSVGAFPQVRISAMEFGTHDNVKWSVLGKSVFDAHSIAPSGSVVCTGNPTDGGRVLDGAKVTANDKGATGISFTLLSPPPLNTVPLGSRMEYLFCGTRPGITDPEDLDPLGFTTRPRASIGVVADVDTPLCILACSLTQGVVVQVTVDSVPAAPFTASRTCASSCPMCAMTFPTIGWIDRLPSMVSEGLHNSVPCVTATFFGTASDPVQFDFSAYCGPMAIGTAGAQHSVQIVYTPSNPDSTTYTTITAIKFKFFAVDQIKASGVQVLHSISPCCDRNHDGVCDAQDFFDYIDAFFGNDETADFNVDGLVNSQDFFDFLTCYFDI